MSADLEAAKGRRSGAIGSEVCGDVRWTKSVIVAAEVVDLSLVASLAADAAEDFA